jgi:hypothetical protein
MATQRALVWLDRAVWTLIYGGLLGLVLGIATGDEHRVAGWSLGVLGGIATVVGVVLIGVRSRQRETPADGAQSPKNSKQGSP